MQGPQPRNCGSCSPIRGQPRPVVRFRMITYLLIWRLTGDRSRQPAAVVNFPVMEGEKALFIHSLDAGDNKAREHLLGVIEDFARKRGYSAVYIHTGKQKKHFLKKNGFEEISEKPIARKVLEP